MRIIFYGTPDFSVPTLKCLLENNNFKIICVVTQPDRPQGRGQKITESPVKKLALAHGIPVLQPENIRKDKESFLADLKKLGKVDVAVVIAFGQILPKAVLQYPVHGSINIHGSLLPRWRGAAPMQRAIMAGDSSTGVALMQMETGLDTGPVYCEQKIQISNEDNLEKLHDKMALIGGQLLCSKLTEICSGKLSPQPQSSEGVTYAHKIEPKDCKIDWNKTATEIRNQIRALDPVPGAFTTAAGKRLKIFDARVVSAMRPGSYTPGEIIVVDSSRLEIQCGKDVLSLSNLQIEGKKRMDVAEFLRGFPLSLKDRFS